MQVDVTFVQIPSYEKGSINYGIKDSLRKAIPLKPGCLKNQQMKRFEDNEPTKVLKDDCVSFKKKGERERK